MVNLAESWSREYQILPGRTHPRMQMHGTCGYILTGTTVVTSLTGNASLRGLDESDANKRSKLES